MHAAYFLTMLCMINTQTGMWQDAPLKALLPSSRYASFVALLQSLGSGPLKKLSLRSSSASVGKAARPRAYKM